MAKIGVCWGKIHRATVTGADLNYVGSVTIDSLLMEAADMRPNQAVRINSVANGTSWETYIVPGKPGKGEIILNGPPAHLFKAGDIVIILAYAQVSLEEADKMPKPWIVFVDENNRITDVDSSTWHPS